MASIPIEGWDKEISGSSSSELDDEDEYCPRLIIDETGDYEECHYETDANDPEIINISDPVIDCTSLQSQNMNHYQQNVQSCEAKLDSKDEVDSNVYNLKVESVEDIIPQSLDDSDTNYDPTADFELGEMLKDEFEALGIMNVNDKDEDCYNEFTSKDCSEIPQWFEKRLVKNIEETKTRLSALKEVICCDDAARIHIEKIEQSYNTPLCRLDQKHPPFNKPWNNYWKFNCSMECKNGLLPSEHIHTIDCQVPILEHDGTGVTMKNIYFCNREFPSYVIHAVELFQHFLECSVEEEFSVQNDKKYKKSIWSYIELRCNYKKELMMIAYGKGVIDENIITLKEFFENGPGRSTSIASLFYVDEERYRLEGDSNSYFTLINGSFGLKDKVGPITISYDPGRNMTFNCTEIFQLGETVLQYLKPTNKTTVLEIGCNSGAVSLMLARACNKVIGLDTSDYKVEKAELLRLENGLQNVSFIKCSPQEMHSKCLSFSKKCISVAILNLASPYGQSIDVMFALRKLATIWRVAVYGSLTEEFHEKLKYLTNLNEIDCERFLPVRACILNKPPLFDNSFDILIIFERKLLFESSAKLISTPVSLDLDEKKISWNSFGSHLRSATKYSPGSKCEMILSDSNLKVLPNMAIENESMDISKTQQSLEFIDLVTPELQPTLNSSDNLITSTVNIKTDYGFEFTVNSHQSYFCQQIVDQPGLDVQKQEIRDYLMNLKLRNIVNDKMIVKEEPISGESSSIDEKNVNLEKKCCIEKLVEGTEIKQEMKELDNVSDDILGIIEEKKLQKYEEVNVKKEDDIMQKFSKNVKRKLQTNAMDRLIDDLIEILREENSKKSEKKMIENNLQKEVIVNHENSLTEKFSEMKRALHPMYEFTSNLLEKSQDEKLKELQDKPNEKNFQKKVIVEEQIVSPEKVIGSIKGIDQIDMLMGDQTDILQDNIYQELRKNKFDSAETSTETKQIMDKTNVQTNFPGLLKEDLQKLLGRRKEILEQLNKDCEICCHVQRVFDMSLPDGDNKHCSLSESRSLSRSKFPISTERDISMNDIRSRSHDNEETVKVKLNSRQESYLKKQAITGWDSREKVELPSIDLREIINRRKKLIYQNQNRHISQLQQVLKSSPFFRNKHQSVNSVNGKLLSLPRKKIPLSTGKSKTDKPLVKESKGKSILSLKHSRKYLLPLTLYKFLYPRLNPRHSLLSTAFYTLSHKSIRSQILQKLKFRKKLLLQQKKKQFPSAIQNFETPLLTSSVDSPAILSNSPNSISLKCNGKSSTSPRQSQHPLESKDKKNDSFLINQTEKLLLESCSLSPESSLSPFLSKPKRSSNSSVTGKSQSPNCRRSEQWSSSGRSTSRSPSIIYVGSKSPASSRRRDSRLSSPASSLPHRSQKWRTTREEGELSFKQKKRTSLVLPSRSNSQMLKRFESPESESSSRASSTSRKSKSPIGFRKRKMISANYRLRSRSSSIHRSKSPSDWSERKREFKGKSRRSTPRVSSVVQRRSKSPVVTNCHRKTSRSSKSGPRLSFSVNRKSNSPHISRRQRSPKSRSRSRSPLINRRSNSPWERRRRSSSKMRSSLHYRRSRSPIVSHRRKSRSRSNSFHSRSESPLVARRWSHPSRFRSRTKSRSKSPISHRFRRQSFLANDYKRRFHFHKYHWHSPAWKYKQSFKKYQSPTYHSKRLPRSRSRSSSSSRSTSLVESRRCYETSPDCHDHNGNEAEDGEIRTKDNVGLYSPISP